MTDDTAMQYALEEARLAAEDGEVPIGAIILKAGKIIGRGRNTRETSNQSIRHAEINAIEAACTTLKTWRLEDCTLYVTLEPCPMCAGAIIQSRIARVVYGADDPKHGAHVSQVNLFDVPFNHTVHVTSGVLAKDSKALLKKFFTALRKSSHGV